MFTVEYVDSVDPLIELVQTDPGAVFAKPQMAYLLFLFGEADDEAANWIRRNLRALDSLLGPDIAGAIFVKSFAVRARVRAYFTPGYGRMKVRDGKVDLREIQFLESGVLATPLFDDYHEPSMLAHQSIEDITATTYASDEIARSLGILGELPCIAFLDAMPGPIRSLQLGAETLPKAMALIRRIVGRLNSADLYDQSRILLEEARFAGEQIASLDRAGQASLSVLDKTLRGLENPLIGQLTTAHQYLRDASARKFRHEIRQTSLSQNVVDPALARASEFATALTHVSRTIRALSWYADAIWPLSDQDGDRVIAILTGHVVEILGDGATKVDANEETVHEMLTALTRVKDEIISKIWGDLPNIRDLEAEYAKAVAATASQSQAERQYLANKAQSLSVTLERKLRELSAAPRITDSFDVVMGDNSDIGAREIELGPEMTERLLKAVTHGVVKIVGRDIYIGTNVGAMGAFANAEGTTFGQNSP